VPLSAIDVVSPAFLRMKDLLFKPFRFGQWLRFAIVGFLAGEMGGSGGCSNFRVPMNFPRSESGEQFQLPFPSGRGALFFIGLALAVFLVLVLALVFAYISSRMRFVLFDSIVDGECHIRESWIRRGRPAFRYFIFQIGIGLAALASIALLIGLPVLLGFSLGLFQNPREHILTLVLGGFILILVFFAWLIAFLLLQVFTKDFIVPQMALDDLTASEAWRRLWAMMNAEKGGYAGYIDRTRDCRRSHSPARLDSDHLSDLGALDRVLPGLFGLFLRRTVSAPPRLVASGRTPCTGSQ
jgi:hypothetical protein